MTIQVEEIRELIEKIEAGKWWDCYAPHHFSALPSGQRTMAAAAYLGNLSDARKLHKALFGLSLFELQSYGSFCDSVITIDGMHYHGEAKTPARAWLIAILSAYAAQMEEG